MTAHLTSDSVALRGATGAGVRIAIIDSGVAVGHPHVGGVSAGTSLVGDDVNDVADRLGLEVQDRLDGAHHRVDLWMLRQ